MVPLTEKLLADAGGWAALKEARALLAAGRVLEARYEPPHLAGRVRGGETEYRAGLRIGSKTDIENTCTCPESRRRAVVCAHSLAVGLAVLAPPKTAPAPTAGAEEQGSREPRGPFPFSSSDGEACALHVILPPNLPAAWPKDSVMVCVEAAVAGGPRKPLAALDAGKIYRCDEADMRLAEKFLALTGGKLAAMATLRRAEFLDLLAAMGRHPRVTFGRSTRVTVEEDARRPTLEVQRTEAGLTLSVRMEPGRRTLLLANNAAWELEGATLRPLARGLSPAYLRLFESPVTVPADAAEAFLVRELPALAAHFEVVGDVAATADGPNDLPEPNFAAHFEGSLNFLTARIEAVYGERRVTLDATGAALARFARNRAAEQAALDRVRAFGFAGPDGKGELTLKGEARTLAFFAVGLPRLEREWKVTVGERFQHVTRNVERIEPRVEVRSSGEQWFELSYELGTASGERFSGADIQRLLQAGQSHLRRKDGRVAVFDSGLLEEFEHLLRDSAPRQMQPGVYRLDRRQAGGLDAFASDHRVAVAGDPRWRQWAGATRNLEKLTPIPLGPLEEALRPYQKQGIYWMHFLAGNGFGGILADEMGLGKTVQALAFLQTLAGQGPCLVVCPSSLIWNWQAEAARWTPEAQVLALAGPCRANDFHKIQKSNLVITSYPLLRRDAESYKGVEFAAVLLDEAQHIKNPDSQNAQSAANLQARRRFVLTGTPVENTVRDVWSLMHFLMPGYLGNRADFRDTFERGIQTDPTGPEAQRLRRRIQPFLLRRTKNTVAKDLPEKLEQVAYCEMTSAQASLYGELVSATRTQLSQLAGEKDQGKARMLALTALLRLRQAACDLRLLGLEKPPSAEECSAKLDLLSELLEEARDGGHRVLVFSQFVSMLGFIRERLDGEGVAYCYLDGSTRDRQAEVSRFQSGNVPAFLISLKAGGTGLNLTAADTVIHFDPWWNPAVEAQATDRAHRIGQRKVVTSYKLIARNTVEEKILSLQSKKKAVIEAAIESEQPMMQGLSMDDIHELLQ
jgi:superfamily II DNA or RNA helicase